MPPNIGQVAATLWAAKVSEDPLDNVFTSQLGHKLLKENGGFGKVDGGEQIEEPLEYAENTTARSYGEMETLDTSRVDVFDAAQYPWKQLAVVISFSELEKARANGDNAKIALVARKVENGKMSLTAEFNRQFYGDGTGNGGKNINGLANLVPSDPTTGTVGNINRATFPFWRSKQTLGTKTTNAYDNLRGAMEIIYNSTSKGAYDEHPEWFVFHQTDFQGYVKTLTANERFISKDSGEGGFKNTVIAFKGCKVTFDEDIASAGTAWCLQGRNLKFRYLQWMRALKPVQPANQLAEFVRCLTIGNLTVNNSRRLGTITVIT